MDGLRLFRNDSTDDFYELSYDFSESELEFLNAAKRHYRTVQQMVEDGLRKPALNADIRLVDICITVNDDGNIITYGFNPDGMLLKIFDNTGELAVTYSPE